MRFATIFLSFVASVAAGRINAEVMPRGGGGGGYGGGGGGGGGGITTVTVTTAVTTTAPGTTPTDIDSGSGSPYVPCSSGLYGTALCCGINVLGVVGLTCDTVEVYPTSAGNFQDYCLGTKYGTPSCCVADLLGLGVLCVDALGTDD